MWRMCACDCASFGVNTNDFLKVVLHGPILGSKLDSVKSGWVVISYRDVKVVKVVILLDYYGQHC